jgi:hypothetical protein
MWRQKKDFSSVIRSVDEDVSRSLELLRAVSDARTTAEGLCASSQAGFSTVKARRCGYNALLQIAKLLCNDALIDDHEELLLERLGVLVQSLSGTPRRGTGQSEARVKDSYLTAAMSASRTLTPANGSCPGRSRATSITASDSSFIDEDATTNINPWARLVEENFFWTHEAVRSPARRRASEIRAPYAVESRPTRSNSAVFLKPSTIAMPQTADRREDIKRDEDPSETLYLEEAELAASALSILDDHPLSNTSLGCRPYAFSEVDVTEKPTATGPKQLTANIGKLFRRTILRPANSDETLSAVTPRSTEGGRPVTPGFAASVVSSEYNTLLKEHFVRVMYRRDHPATSCIKRFVAANSAFVVLLGGGNPHCALELQADLFDCPLGSFRHRDAAEVLLLDRIFFISALCDRWTQKMFADRGIPHTSELTAPSASLGRPVGHRPKESSLGPPQNDFVEPRSLTWQSRLGPSPPRWGQDATKIDISEPVRDFLPELLDSQIEFEALRLLLATCDEEDKLASASAEGIIRDTPAPFSPREERSASAQLLLDGLSRKLSEQLLALVDRLLNSHDHEMPFAGIFYEALLDLLVTTYNVIEFAALAEAGTSVGADVVFPLLVEAVAAAPHAARRLRRIVKWMDHSSVAKRLPMMSSKGLSAYVVLSFTAALDVAAHGGR